MMYVKIMANEDKADSDSYKNFKMFAIQDDEEIQFLRDQSWPEDEDPRFVLLINKRRPEPGEESTNQRVYPLTGNAYVLNTNGKTIASHGCYTPNTD